MHSDSITEHNSPSGPCAPAPAKFLWIAGPSSVGKRTTIDKCLADPHWCREFFALGNCKIVEAQYLCTTKNKPHSPDKNAIADILAKADTGGGAVTVLIFWQACYRTAVAYLKEEKPTACHFVAHLHRDRASHIKSYLDDYRRRYDSDELALDAFDKHGTNDRSFVEAYRQLVDRFIDVAIIGGDYYLI